MIGHFNLEIIPEIYGCDGSDSVYSVRFQVKTHKNRYTVEQIVSIEELQTNSILDLMFKTAKEKLKELIDKETLEKRG